MSELTVEQQPYIGSYVLESLTTGIYGESENAIREYVQNAFDSTRSAVQQKLITEEAARITVMVTSRDQITIYDNGVGVAAAAAYKTLTSIGASKKDRQKQAGFRGIGRLAGIAKRSIIVHHRAPGKSVMGLILSLCPGCHAKIHRTKAVLSAMPPLLLELWREQHPKGHEQVQLDFSAKGTTAKPASLFET